MSDSRKKEEKKKDKRELVPVNIKTAADLVAIFNKMLEEGSMTSEEYVAFASIAKIFEKTNPSMAQAFKPSIDGLYPQMKKYIGEYLTLPDLDSVARTNKENLSIFKEGFDQSKLKEAERAHAVIIAARTDMQLRLDATNAQNKQTVAKVFYYIFSKRKSEFKHGQIIFGEETDSKAVANQIKQIFAEKQIEQRIFLHAFALDEKRAKEKICPEAKINDVLAASRTEFYIEQDRINLRLNLSKESVMYLAQIFNAYYPDVGRVSRSV
ncbi:MAG: hypothetical protein ACYCQI_13485 [Gammaproteobacteria bacterium]